MLRLIDDPDREKLRTWGCRDGKHGKAAQGTGYEKHHEKVAGDMHYDVIPPSPISLFRGKARLELMQGSTDDGSWWSP